MKVLLANDQEMTAERVTINYSLENDEYQLNIELEESVSIGEVKKAFTPDACTKITVQRQRKADKVFEGYQLVGFSESFSDNTYDAGGVLVTLTKGE